MSIELVQPDGLPVVDLYRPVSVASGSRIVHLAGQVAWGPDGRTVGVDDLEAQVEQAYLNVAKALEGVGATFEHVVKLTAYFTDLGPGRYEQFMAGRAKAYATLGITVAPPFTGVGVPFLAGPDLLVEIEAVAVLP